MKKLLLITAIAFLLFSCEKEDQQNNCFCENGKWFIPNSEQRVYDIPELGLPYEYLPTEYNCETFEPITTPPTTNSKFLGCE